MVMHSKISRNTSCVSTSDVWLGCVALLLASLTASGVCAQASSPSGRAEVSNSNSSLPDLLHLQLFAGPSYAHLAAFSNRNLLTVDPGSLDLDGFGGQGDFEGQARRQLLDENAGWGHSLGVAAGVRLLAFTFGARAAWGRYDAFEVSTLMLEAGLRPKIWFVEPYLRAGFGYAWLTSDALSGTMGTIDGVAAELGAGLDFRLGALVSVGLGVDADVLNLSHGTDVSRAASVSLQEGSAVGVQVRAQGHLTLHI